MTELVCHLFNWSHIWYAHPGAIKLSITDSRWFVGNWTGPDGDLLCIKEAHTKEQAEKFLSPGSRTILGSVIKP